MISQIKYVGPHIAGGCCRLLIQSIIKKQIPYSIGGGIGISRVLMFLFQKSHIAEIQASSWDSKTLESLKDRILL